MRIDASHHDAVALCPRCSWRGGPYVDRTGARAALMKHTETAHALEASAAISKARERTRRRGLTT